MNIKQTIEEILAPDEYIYGFADLTGLLNKKYSNYPFAISIGRKMDDDIIDELQYNGPTRKYYDLYTDTNNSLQLVIDNISDALRANNIDSIKIKPTYEDGELDEKYHETLVTDFSHKMAATRAGLGWIGKTDLFVSDIFGPRLRLATLLTNHELPLSKLPYDESYCGQCNICVSKCPAKAANGLSWNIHIPREKFYDAFKCRNKCRELTKEKLDVSTSLCGICVSVCPIGKT
jgi:epoxyqueuosine reductase